MIEHPFDTIKNGEMITIEVSEPDRYSKYWMNQTKPLDIMDELGINGVYIRHTFNPIDCIMSLCYYPRNKTEEV